ncbi:MAG: hypothetical protein ACI38Q_02355 [Candidatus Bruticola sp.]
MLIYHTNDMHGHGEALAWLSSRASAAVAADKALYFDSGDALIGSNTVWKNFEPNLEKMSAIGCAAMAMGNREFNYQRRILDKRAKQRSFPLICTNLSDMRLSGPLDQHEFVENIQNIPLIDCSSVNWRQSQIWQELSSKRWIPALALFNRSWSSNYALLILSAVPVQYPHNAVWEKLFGFRFFEAETTLPQVARRYSKNIGLKTNLIILSHIGFDRDQKLAENLPPGTWILGGHTHTRLDAPCEINGSFIVQTGAFAQNINKIDYNIENPQLSTCELLSLA